MDIERDIIQSSWWNWLLKAQRLIMFTSNIVLLAVLATVILARYVFYVNVFGYDEIILVAAYWMYFIGGSYAMYEESHVKADILASIFPENINRVFKVIVEFIQIAVGCVFIYLGVQMLRFDFIEYPTTSAWNIPTAIPHFAIVLGFVLMTFYSAVYFVRDILIIKNAKKENASSEGVESPC